MKYIALFLLFATPAVLAETFNMACPPGDKVVIHTVTNDGDFNSDGVIDGTDVGILKIYFGEVTNPDNDSVLTDLNGDGITNYTDITLLRMLAKNHN